MDTACDVGPGEPVRLPCVLGQFKCANHRCIDGAGICNEVDDCGDMSDELGCGQLQLLFLSSILVICSFVKSGNGHLF